MKKQVSRFIAAFLAAAMSTGSTAPLSIADMTVLPPSLTAYAEDLVYGDFTYAENSTGITIISYKGSSESVTVPAQIDGKPVTAIGQKAFAEHSEITSLSLPSTVTDIGARAFYRCSGITAIYLEGVVNIGEYAFLGTSLSEVTIPLSLESCFSAFSGCQTLTKAVIANGRTTVPDGCFHEAAQLSEVVIPSSVTVIGKSAFHTCKSLTQINLHEGLTTIGEYAFTATYISEVTIPVSVETCSKAFHNCYGLKKVTFADGRKEIPEYCLESAKDVTEVIMPSSVTVIGNCAFQDCDSLAELNFHEGLETIGSSAFYSSGLREAVLPSTAVNLTGAFYGAYFLENISFPDGIETIPENVCRSDSRLKSVVMPETVRSIGDYAFYQCSALTDITLHEGLEELGNCCLSDIGAAELTIPSTIRKCDSFCHGYRYLRKVIFADGIENIPYHCLKGTAIQEVVLPDSVKTISGDAFNQCKQLSTVNLPEGLETINPNAFSNTTKLEEITIPSTLKSARAAFHSSGLKKVVFADGIETVPYGILTSCTSLEKVVLPDSVKVIDTEAFIGTKKLQSIKFPENLKTIRSNAFNGSGLRNVAIPDSVTQLGNSAFEKCTRLRTAIIGNGVTSIPQSIFSGDTSLRKVVLPDTLEGISYDSFAGCPELSEIIYQGDASSLKRTNGSFSNDYSLKDSRFIHLNFPGSQISVDKSSAAVGSKLTFTVSFDAEEGFSEENSNRILNIEHTYNLEIDPDSVEILSGTPAENGFLKTGSSSSSMKFTSDSGKVRFTATVKNIADFKVSANLQLTHVGSSIYNEPVGQVSIRTNSLKLTVPQVSNSLAPTVSGIGPKGVPIDILMNGKVVASPVSDDMTGAFYAEIDLPKDTKDGAEFTFSAVYDEVATDESVLTYSAGKPAIRSIQLKTNEAEGFYDITDTFTEQRCPVFIHGTSDKMSFRLDISNSDLLYAVYVTATAGNINRKYAAYESEDGVWTITGNFVYDVYKATTDVNFVLVSKEDAEAGKAVDFTDVYYSSQGNIRFSTSSSGMVYAGESSNPVSGAEFTLVGLDDNGDEYVCDLTKYGQKPHTYSDEKGNYIWSIPAGEWKILCNAEGYDPVESKWFTIPQDNARYNFNLTNDRPGEVTDITYDNNVITVKFSKYMQPESINTPIVTITGLPDAEIVPVYHGSEEATTDTFTVSGNYSEAIDVTVLVSPGALSYEGIPSKQAKDKTFHINDPAAVTTASAPETTTSHATVTTTASAPVTSTESSKPATTTNPVTSTAVQAATTDKAVATTAKPAVTTEKPVTTTAAPATTTDKAAATTDKPAVTTTKPATTTAVPVTSTVNPVTTTAEPAGTVNLTVATYNPAATTTPTTATAIPDASTSVPASTGTSPGSTAPAVTTASGTVIPAVSTETVPVTTTSTGSAAAQTTPLTAAVYTTYSSLTDTAVTTTTVPVTTTPAEPPVFEGTLGDVNNDGLIDSSDASDVLFEYARLSTGGDPVIPTIIADVNSDGRVNSSDATLILAYYVQNAVGGDMSFEEFLRENL